MSLALELKKVRRTGLFPAFLGGGILASAVPVINMAVRSEMYLEQNASPVQILMTANWQMISMLNILLVVAGACLLYHIEFADHAMQKLKSLPFRECSVFFGKTFLLIMMTAAVLLLETGSILFCTYYWWKIESSFWPELMKNLGYEFVLILPCIVLSLLISSAFENMWLSLGIGVVCVFTATMLPVQNFWLSLFPFAMPFQIFAENNVTQTVHYLCAAGIEFTAVCLAELLFIKLRRTFE